MLKKNKNRFICLFFLNHLLHFNLFATECIIFSYDRPLQLYALLESIDRYIQNTGPVNIIYRTSSESYAQAYLDVFKKFETKLELHSYLQNSSSDFKSITLEAIAKVSSEYMYFAVDDMIVKDTVDLNMCIDALKKYDAYGFFLRLGTNCTHNNYPYLKPCKQPTFKHHKGICSWTFSQGQGDWRYCNTVDMTIYATSDIKNDLENLSFHNPNSLEGAWFQKSFKRLKRKGLCFENSCTINIPLNRVQNTHQNFNLEIPPVELLNIFNQGQKINIDQFYQINNISPHESHQVKFIDRNK